MARCSCFCCCRHGAPNLLFDIRKTRRKRMSESILISELRAKIMSDPTTKALSTLYTTFRFNCLDVERADLIYYPPRRQRPCGDRQGRRTVRDDHGRGGQGGGRPLPLRRRDLWRDLPRPEEADDRVQRKQVICALYSAIPSKICHAYSNKGRKDNRNQSRKERKGMK